MPEKLLKAKSFFKLVCGAGNEDCESVKRLVYTFAKAGWKCFDISAREEILDSAEEGVRASGESDIHFCVSIGIKGDPHISKAKILKEKCIKCQTCIRNCPNGAITELFDVDEKKCIGCGICKRNCMADAVMMYEKDIDYRKILPKLSQRGVEIFELHIMGNDKNDMERKWSVINECNPKLASICIDRENFGNKEVLNRINEMIKSRKPYTTIIQADGIPMSGSDDSYKTTLQAVAMAEIIQNANLPVYLTASGGTNSKTAELCRLCGINIHGIAIGSWARKIVKPYITAEDFWTNESKKIAAIELAHNLMLADTINCGK